MYNNQPPMCKYDYDTRDRDYEDHVREETKDGHRILRYSDGSSKVCGAGPAGPMDYDQDGNEC